MVIDLAMILRNFATLKLYLSFNNRHHPMKGQSYFPNKTATLFQEKLFPTTLIVIEVNIYMLSIFPQI